MEAAAPSLVPFRAVFLDQPPQKGTQEMGAPRALHRRLPGCQGPGKDLKNQSLRSLTVVSFCTVTAVTVESTKHRRLSS